MENLIITRQRRNYAGKDPQCNDGDEFIGCNLAQKVPGTEICKGRKGLRFIKCNLARAIVPEDSIIDDCNTSQVELPPEIDSVADRVEAIDFQIAELQAEKQQLEAS